MTERVLWAPLRAASGSPHRAADSRRRPAPGKTTRRYPLYHQIEDPVQRRLAIIHLHADGWSVGSITGYLQASRPTVYAAPRRWFADQFADLADHSHARKPAIRKSDLKAIAAIRDLQESPGLGEYRIHAALKQHGINEGRNGPSVSKLRRLDPR